MHREIIESAENWHGISNYQAAVKLVGGSAAVTELRSARWERMGAGVYRLRGAPRTWEQRVAALSLAAGPAAAASHRSAAGLLGLPGFARHGLPEVTTPRTRRHRGPAGIVHRWRPFPADHLTVVDGILTTRVARTLVDLAGILHPLRAERAVDSCLGSGLVTLDSLRATFSDLAGRGRKGIAVMRVVLDERPGSYVAPESELESRFLHLAHLGGLPEPVRQLNTGDDANWIGRVDFAYPDARLLVELDGRANHTSKLDRETDAGRDARLVAAGWRRIERFTWDDITRRGDAAVERLRLAMTGEPSNR